MPFFRHASRNIYFVHVPKCGGTSVEHALMASGIKLSFLDERFGLHDYVPWNRSSPQHLIHLDRTRLFDDGFFDFEFALIRDPVHRFLSAFNHHRRSIGVFVTLSQFVDRIERRNRKFDDYFGYRHDNHFVPAARFCTPQTKVFRLEDGMARFFEAISAEIGVSLREVPRENVRDYSFTRSGTWLRRGLKRAFSEDSPKLRDLSPEMVERIRALYREDYERFAELAVPPAPRENDKREAAPPAAIDTE